MMPIKTYNKIKTIVLYFVIKKNLEISFQNGPEHETTSLKITKKNKTKLLSWRWLEQVISIQFRFQKKKKKNSIKSENLHTFRRKSQ